MTEADEGASERQERLMDIRSPLVPDRQPPVPGQPCQRPFDHPAVTAQALAGIDALARDPDRDVAAPQEPSAPGQIVRLVGMQLRGAFAAAACWRPDQRHGIDQRLEDHAVVPVRAGQEGRQGNALAIGDQMPFRAWLAAIGGIRPDRLAPLFAGTLALSRLARSQSIRSASPSRSSSVWWSRSQTPAFCQSRRRRQQVTPEPHPISWGSISHGMPDFSTKMMPVRVARSGTRGRPPLGLGGVGGSRGSTMVHNSSETRSLVIAQIYHIILGYEMHS